MAVPRIQNISNESCIFAKLILVTNTSVCSGMLYKSGAIWKATKAPKTPPRSWRFSGLNADGIPLGLQAGNAFPRYAAPLGLGIIEDWFSTEMARRWRWVCFRLRPGAGWFVAISGSAASRARRQLASRIEWSMRPMRRSRVIYFGLVVGTVLLGLGSRRFRSHLPAILGEYAGDTLWAAMVYFLTAAIWNRATPGRLAVGAFSFAVAVELSQLYQAVWINTVRDTWFGGLVLGHSFLWSDLVCYAIGVALALGIDAAAQRNRQ